VYDNNTVAEDKALASAFTKIEKSNNLNLSLFPSIKNNDYFKCVKHRQGTYQVHCTTSSHRDLDLIFEMPLILNYDPIRPSQNQLV
jgi:hypothetical protein